MRRMRKEEEKRDGEGEWNVVWNDSSIVNQVS